MQMIPEDSQNHRLTAMSENDDFYKKQTKQSVFVHVYPAEGTSLEQLKTKLSVKNLDNFTVNRERSLEVKVTSDKLSDLAALNEVKFVKKALYMHEHALSGEQVGLLNVSNIHRSLGDGQGVKIGIIDTGFSNYTALLGTELPASVNTMDFTGDGIASSGIHGTAVAEIVHEMAPEAELYLYKVYTTSHIDQAVDQAILDGVNVINMSLGLYLSSFGDGTGELIAITEKASDAGILWFNSAGNEADIHYSASYNEQAYSSYSDFGNFNTGSFHRFKSGGATKEAILNEFSVFDGYPVSIILAWDGNFSGFEDTDYGLYLWKWDGFQYEFLGFVDEVQDGDFTDYPYESYSFVPDGNGLYAVSVRYWDSSTREPFRLFIDGAYFIEHTTPAGSLTQPADSPYVLSVGAVDYTNWGVNDELSYYSSRGPTWDGRVKPELVAPTAITNESYGSFSGTSASSPVAAGMAAQIWSAINNPNKDRVAFFMTNFAYDFADAGLDNLSGYGRIADYLPIYPVDSESLLLTNNYFPGFFIWEAPYNKLVLGEYSFATNDTGSVFSNGSIGNLASGDVGLSNDITEGDTFFMQFSFSNYSHATAPVGWNSGSIIDKTAPSPFLLSSFPEAFLPSNNFNYSWEASLETGSGLDYYELELSGDQVSVLETYQVKTLNTNLTGLSDGSDISIRLRAKDIAGLYSPYTDWTPISKIDGSAPEGFSIQDNGDWATSNILFTMTEASDAHTGLEKYIFILSTNADFSTFIISNESSNAVFTYNVPEGLSTESFYLKGMAINQAGLVTNVTTDGVQLDLYQPEPLSLQTQPGAKTNSTFTYAWSEGVDNESGISGYDAEYLVNDDTILSNLKGTEQTNLQIEVKLHEAIVRFRVRAIDEAGNVSTWSPWTDPTEVDTEASQTEMLGASMISPNTDVILSSSESDAKIYYAWANSNSEPISFYPYETSLIASNLLTSTYKDLYFYSVDAVGNVEETNKVPVNFVVEMTGDVRPLGNYITLDAPLLRMQFEEKGTYQLQLINQFGHKGEILKLNVERDGQIIDLDINEFELDVDLGIYTAVFLNENIDHMQFIIGL